jgi:predicted CXXCH cytochrome family protein
MNKKLLFILIFLFSSMTCPALCAQENSCLECHLEMDDELKAPAEAFQFDIHQKFGLACTSCHGGNQKEEDIDLAKDSSFQGAPEKSEIPVFCGSCHAKADYMRQFSPGLRIDQLELYWTSQHGQSLMQGDSKAAVCTDCHQAHGILEANHPKSSVFPWNIPEMCGKCHSDKKYMQDYAIPINQWKEYKESVHARALFVKKDLSAPVCNDCHGNHGAAPPEVTSIAFICRQCHPSTGELFSKSPHKQAYDALEISECEACHGNHKILPSSDEMLGTGEGSVCVQCHEPDSQAYKTASAFKSKLDSFKEGIQWVAHLLERAENKGVEVSEPKFRLKEANTRLITARNLTHSLDITEFEEKITEGEKVLDEVRRLGEDALAEAKFRRTGLIIATIFIFLLAVALYLKIKQIEKRPSSQIK